MEQGSSSLSSQRGWPTPSMSCFHKQLIQDEVTWALRPGAAPEQVQIRWMFLLRSTIFSKMMERLVGTLGGLPGLGVYWCAGNPPTGPSPIAGTYLASFIKWAHMGKPGSRAEPGGHDHSGAMGRKHLEAISIDRINRKEQLVTTTNHLSPTCH